MRRTSWAEEPVKPAPPSPRSRGIVDCPLPPALRLAFLYLILVTLHTGYFVHRHGGDLWVVGVSAPLGFLLGMLLHYFGLGVSLVRARVVAVMSPLLTGFLLFFLFLIGYILVFSVVVSFPVEWCIHFRTDSPQLAQQYVLFSMDMVVALAILSWLRWLLRVVGLYPRQSG